MSSPVPLATHLLVNPPPPDILFWATDRDLQMMEEHRGKSVSTIGWTVVGIAGGNLVTFVGAVSKYVSEPTLGTSDLFSILVMACCVVALLFCWILRPSKKDPFAVALAAIRDRPANAPGPPADPAKSGIRLQ